MPHPNGVAASIQADSRSHVGQSLSLSERLAAERTQVPQPPTGPITPAMVVAAGNYRWPTHPEYYNGTLHTLHEPLQQSYPAMQEGYRGVSRAERDFDL